MNVKQSILYDILSATFLFGCMICVKLVYIYSCFFFLVLFCQRCLSWGKVSALSVALIKWVAWHCVERHAGRFCLRNFAISIFVRLFLNDIYSLFRALAVPGAFYYSFAGALSKNWRPGGIFEMPRNGRRRRDVAARQNVPVHFSHFQNAQVSFSFYFYFLFFYNRQQCSGLRDGVDNTRYSNVDGSAWPITSPIRFSALSFFALTRVPLSAATHDATLSK